MPGFFNVIVRRDARNNDVSAFAQLLCMSDYDLGAAVVLLQHSLDLNFAAFELMNVAHSF